ncbi:MAG: hypothetical protein DME99_09245 [Verrucomicrobia bacterium]|nr:MAG: hypothetical protein DME99_09245 [Verrucomicrobiota bacterium]
MGRKANFVKVIAALSASISFCAVAQAQPHRPSGRPPSTAPYHPPPGQNPQPSQGIRERWLALPPAARQNFERNAERWLRMSPAERDILRQRENQRREQIRRETEAAVRDSGLRLNPQERAQFESRYIQERRKVEQSLRQQIEAERQQQLPALIQQLKKEFQIDQPNRNPATKSAESPKSKK